MPVLASPLGLLPALAFFPVRVAGCPAVVPLPFACQYGIPCGLCVPPAWSGCPSRQRCVSVAFLCARAPAAYAPPPLSGSVWRAHYVRFRCRAPVEPFEAVHAPPRFLPRSRAPPFLLFGGVARSLRPLALLGAARLPGGRPAFFKLALRPLGAARGRPGGNAPRLCVGRPGLGALPRPTAVLGACGRGPLPTRCGRGGLWGWRPVTDPTARALAGWLCALWGRHQGAWGGCLLPCCRASTVGRSPGPDRPSLGRAAGAHYPLAVVAGVVGVGTRHQPHSARSCELALRALEAAQGRLVVAPLACVWGVRGWALSHAGPLVLGACGRALLPTGCGCGVRAWGPGCPWHLLLCSGWPCVVRASRVCGTRWPLLFGTCLPAVVVAGGVPLRRASWPCVGVPRLVLSGRSRCSGRLSGRPGASSRPGGCGPRLYWAAAWGTWRPAENRALCACCLPLSRQGRWARSASYPFGAPRWGCPWRVPPASVLGCVRCGDLACVDPVTDASGFRYRPSFDRGLGRCSGAVSSGRRHLPFLGQRMPHPGPARVCLCVLFLAGSGRPASRARFGAPHLSCARSVLLPCSAFSGLRCPCFGCLFVFPVSVPCPFFPSLLSRPCCLQLFVLPGPRCPGASRSSFAPTPPPPPQPTPFFWLCFVVLLFLPPCDLRPCSRSLWGSLVPGLCFLLFPPTPDPFFSSPIHRPPPSVFRVFSPPPAPSLRSFVLLLALPSALALCGPPPPLSLPFFSLLPLCPPPLSRLFCCFRPWVPGTFSPPAPLLLCVWPCVWCVRCVLGLVPPSGGCSCFAVSRVLLCGAAVCCGLFCVVRGVLRCFSVPWGVVVVLCGVLSCRVVGFGAGGLPWALFPPPFFFPRRAVSYCAVLCCAVCCPGARCCPVIGSAALCGVFLPPPPPSCCCPLLPLPGPCCGSFWCSVLGCGAVLVCCAACRVVCCCLRRFLLVLPCCFVRAGWC